MATYT